MAEQCDMRSCNTCIDAGQGRRESVVELEVLCQESGVADQREGKAEADDERQEQRVSQHTPARSRQVCHTSSQLREVKHQITSLGS